MKEDVVVKIKKLRENIRLFADKDQSHDDLGVANGFHDAERYKQDFCNYTTIILQKMVSYIDKLDETYIEDPINLIETTFQQVVDFTNKIEKLVEAGVHNPNFPKQREQHSAQLQQRSINIKKQLHALELELKMCEMSKKINETDFIENIRISAEAEVKKAAYAAESAEKSAKNAQKVLDAAQNKTIAKGVEDSASHFGSLYAHHKDYEFYWLLALIAALLAVTASVIFAFLIDVPDKVTLGTLISLMKRIFLVSVPSVFLKLALTKYNAERSLSITYAHREKVLEQ